MIIHNNVNMERLVSRIKPVVESNRVNNNKRPEININNKPEDAIEGFGDILKRKISEGPVFNAGADSQNDISL
ncbi:MAG: hypothetical protein N4A47_05555 [Clostridia bacterium]|jgi:hypothetical protein|nr:hypothetical protein [Clostridia bacterium]